MRKENHHEPRSEETKNRMRNRDRTKQYSLDQGSNQHL